MRINNKQRELKIHIAGKIAVGETRVSDKGGKPYPVSLDYFKIICSDQKVHDAIMAYQSKFADTDGKIRKLLIQFVEGASIDNYYVAQANDGRPQYKSDGVQIWESKEKGWELLQTSDYDATMAEIGRRTKGWKEYLRMTFVVLGNPNFSVFSFSTKAEKSSIDAIVSSYDMYDKNGGVAGRKFFLHVKKVKSGRAGVTNTFPVVSLEYAENTEAVLEAGLKPLMIGRPVERTLEIAAPKHEEHEEHEDFTEYVEAETEPTEQEINEKYQRLKASEYTAADVVDFKAYAAAFRYYPCAVQLKFTKTPQK
jgi:microcompartment protein CcmL/EutN